MCPAMDVQQAGLGLGEVSITASVPTLWARSANAVGAGAVPGLGAVATSLP